MSMRFVQRTLLIIAGIILFPAAESGAATVVVTNTNDAGPGSFREALDACWSAGKDTIVFSIPVTDPGYDPVTRVWTIRPSAGYGVPDGTTVDGTVAVPASEGRNLWRPGIEIDGMELAKQGIIGLFLYSEVSLRGLVVNHFQYGIRVAANNVIVERCFVGTDPTGRTAKYNGGDGILIIHEAAGAVIQENLISGNEGCGIRISGAPATGNIVRNNRVGTDSTGTAALPNKIAGISLHSGAHDNMIENNLVSGNTGIGIHLYDAGTNGNRIRENRIGTSADGNTPLPNATFGVSLFNGPCNNVIGPDNRIAFNGRDGVLVDGSNSFTGTVGNTVTGNSIAANGGKGIFNFRGGNAELAAPAVTSVTPSRIAGTAVSLQTVDVYLDEKDEGACFIGSTPADAGGNFELSVTNPLTLPCATATSTDANGNTSEFSTPFFVSVIDEKGSTGLRNFSLHQNHPNPFNAATTIRFDVKMPCTVRLAVCDVAGKERAVPTDRRFEAGSHEIRFDASGLASGVYLYRIQMGGFTAARKMVVMK